MEPLGITSGSQVAPFRVEGRQIRTEVVVALKRENIGEQRNVQESTIVKRGARKTAAYSVARRRSLTGESLVPEAHVDRGMPGDQRSKPRQADRVA